MFTGQTIEYRNDFLLAAISHRVHRVSGEEQIWQPVNEFDTAIVGAA
mgnify:CR=1 FL=1